MVGLKSALSLLVISVAGAHAQCILTAGKVNLLSAQGLATPWTLSGGCSQTDTNTQTFLEATVYEPSMKQIFAYSPLIIDAGTKPLVPPVFPNITNQAVIVYHFGCNANTLTLADSNNGQTLENANCVNGVQGSVFGQFAYCNAVAFFQAAGPGLQGSIPPLGTAFDGSVCPTTRSFTLIDQDQSDNVVTTYLQVGKRTAQNTAANLKKFSGTTVISNPSDNALLTEFLDPAIGCSPFKIQSLDDPTLMRSTMAGDELSAAAFQAQPHALMPVNDPMVLNNGNMDMNKVNLYRVGVNQPQSNGNDASGEAYCTNFANLAPSVILRQGKMTAKRTSPVPAQGNTLFTFLGSRFNASWVNLNCEALIGKPSPIIANVDGNGVAISLTFFMDGKMFGPTSTGGNIEGVPVKSVTAITASSTSTMATSKHHGMTSATAASVSATTAPTLSVTKTKHHGGMGTGQASNSPATTAAAPSNSNAGAGATATETNNNGGRRNGGRNGGRNGAGQASNSPATTAAAPSNSNAGAGATATATNNNGGRHNGGRNGAGQASNSPATTAAAPTNAGAGATATATNNNGGRHNGGRNGGRHGRHRKLRRSSNF